ncbi:hypothetical protein EBT25_00270 [bacterium]|jgi:hypothetical protein|nr:hypothetical protein [bacterium]
MPQAFSTFYKPGVPNLFGSTVFKPSDISLQDLWSKVGKYKGIDFNTGKTVDLALEELQKQYGGTLPTTPSVTGAGSLSPTDLDIEQYVKLQKALQPGLLDTEVKQNVLGLGAATAFGAASLPFTEYMRNQELNRQMEAFRMKELSPTAQAARNLSMQQQLGLAASAQAEKRRAFGDLKRATVEPFLRG